MWKKGKSEEIQTIIGPNCSLEGRIQDLNSVQLDGKLSGDLQTEGDVFVGKYGFVQGNIRGKNVFVHGKVEGNISAEERIELAENSRVEGDLKTGKLVIHEGAVFRGMSHMEEIQVAPSVEQMFRGDGDR